MSRFNALPRLRYVLMTLSTLLSLPGRLQTCGLTGESVSPVLVCMISMPGDPFPPDVVLLGDLIELVPEVLVQDRLSIGSYPAIKLPFG